MPAAVLVFQRARNGTRGQWWCYYKDKRDSVKISAEPENWKGPPKD